MIITNKPDMNYGVWAENGNIEIPSSEKVEEGWVIEKPLNEQMNWLQNRQDRMLQYLNQRGIPEWDIRTDYPVNAHVARAGIIYKALSSNTDKDPTLNTGIWEIAFVSYSDFVDYSETVNSIVDTDGFVSHYVRKSEPVLDAPARGVAYNNKTGDTGLSFSEETPVIKSNGTTVAEFSGGYNPKDVVTHEQLALAIQNYKVGDIYITTADGNPSERLGYGNWERFAEGKTLVGFTTSVSNEIPEWVKVAGRTNGVYKNTITFPHSGWDVDGLEISTSRQGELVVGSGFKEKNEILESLNQPRKGLTQVLDNVQPSIVVYFWKRTA